MPHTGIALEIKATCSACNGALAVNGLFKQVLCPACHASRDLDAAAWEVVLEDVLKEAPLLAPDEGRTSQIMASAAGAFDLKYGHQNPRCQGCKTPLPVEELPAFAARGFAFCTGCGARVAVRPAPADVTPLVPAGAILVGEEAAQVGGGPAGAGGLAPAPASQPINFACPSCAASLPVDGTSRSVTCRYCGNHAYLPDPVWLRLHPVKGASRWYVWMDVAERPFEWSDVDDVVADGFGNLYVVGEPGDCCSSSRVFSLDPQLRLRWVRQDLECNDDTRLALTPTGHLLVANPQKRPLLALSCVDGATAGKVGGTGAPGVLDYEAAKSFAVDTDGTILVVGHDCLRRFAADGREVEPWPGARPARWLLRYGGRARLIGADGVPRFVTQKSREEDEERRVERQKRPDEW
ncbi:MAG TPA: hypothetical protein VGQ83_04030 [Polyangia bacterium]|jgi:hypothetical protein